MDIYGAIKTFLKKQKALTETKKSSKFLSFLYAIYMHEREL